MAKKKHIYKKRRKGLFISAVVIVILLSMLCSFIHWERILLSLFYLCS